ncbi:hypothetical protein [Caulobacter sp.]|uniref:hypothetical protein n=1 Tax=Caulobacter sp. TaxID=78 RepID=UPI00161D9B36
MRAIVVSVVSAMLAAGPVWAQQSADAPVVTAAPQVQAPPADTVPQALDPLADLIAQQTGLDEEQAEAASAPAPRHRATILPIPPPEPTGPAIPQGGYVPAEKVYEMRVKGSIAAAQNLQGPLDGGWKIAGADGGQLYALQLVDKAGGYGELEGAWRDVRRPGSVGSTGLIEDLRRDGSDVVVRFSPRGGQSSVLTLRPVGQERWAGQLSENGEVLAVVAEQLRPEAPPGYETERRGPYVWPGPQRVAASRPAPAASAPACSTKGKTGKALKAAKAKCAAAAKRGKGAAVKKGGKAKAKATTARKGKATAKKPAAKKKR